MHLISISEIPSFYLASVAAEAGLCPTWSEPPPPSPPKTGFLVTRHFISGVNQSPQNSSESVRLLKSLQPLLQEAIQNKRVTRLWEHTYKLQGPLTWKEFHQLAGRGTDENSEPQPIPSFLVGFDKDATTVSPYALRFWVCTTIKILLQRNSVSIWCQLKDKFLDFANKKTYVVGVH